MVNIPFVPQKSYHDSILQRCGPFPASFLPKETTPEDQADPVSWPLFSNAGSRTGMGSMAGT